MAYKDLAARREYGRAYRKLYPEKQKGYWKRWWLKRIAADPEYRKVKNRRNRACWLKNADYHHAKQFLRGLTYKAKILSHYGRECACCGEDNLQFLTIDHINCDGKEHRKKIGPFRLYKWLENNGFPPGFQVLCYNCNCGRRTKEICPHIGFKFTVEFMLRP